MFVMLMHPPGRARQGARGHEKIFPNVLKRGAGESDRDSRPSSAMALSTPRQPATRGLDDPGRGGVPPAADWGVSHHSTATHCRQCHTSPVPATVGPGETNHDAPRGADCACGQTAGGDLKNPKLRCGRHGEEENLFLPWDAAEAGPLSAHRPSWPNGAGSQLVLARDAAAPDGRSCATTAGGAAQTHGSCCDRVERAGLSQPPDALSPTAVAVLRGIEGAPEWHEWLPLGPVWTAAVLARTQRVSSGPSDWPAVNFLLISRVHSNLFIWLFLFSPSSFGGGQSMPKETVAVSEASVGFP